MAIESFKNHTRPVVYISGPLTHGDQWQNVGEHMAVAHEFILNGYAVIVPALFHFIHMWAPMHYETWIEVDLALLRKADAVYRIQGPSHGADREEVLAAQISVPVYEDMGALMKAIPPQTLD